MPKLAIDIDNAVDEASNKGQEKDTLKHKRDLFDNTRLVVRRRQIIEGHVAHNVIVFVDCV